MDFSGGNIVVERLNRRFDPEVIKPVEAGVPGRYLFVGDVAFPTDWVDARLRFHYGHQESFSIEPEEAITEPLFTQLYSKNLEASLE